MTRPTIDITCEIVRDNPCEAAIAITDGTPDLSGRSLFPGERWFWIPRDEITGCEPPVARLKHLANGAREGTVTLTIPEWLAVDRGLV